MVSFLGVVMILFCFTLNAYASEVNYSEYDTQKNIEVLDIEENYVVSGTFEGFEEKDIIAANFNTLSIDVDEIISKSTNVR